MLLNKIKAYLTGWKDYYDPLIEDIIFRKALHGARVYTKGFMLMILYKKYKIKFPMLVTNDKGEALWVTKQEFFSYISEKIDKLKGLVNGQ